MFNEEKMEKLERLIRDIDRRLAYLEGAFQATKRCVVNRLCRLEEDFCSNGRCLQKMDSKPKTTE